MGFWTINHVGVRTTVIGLVITVAIDMGPRAINHIGPGSAVIGLVVVMAVPSLNRPARPVRRPPMFPLVPQFLVVIFFLPFVVALGPSVRRPAATAFPFASR